MTGARRTSVLGLDWRNCRDLPDDELEVCARSPSFLADFTPSSSHMNS